MASNSPIRFAGMASGMDTEALVKAMVTRHQTRVDDKKKSQTLLEWKRDAYKETSLKFNSFYTDFARKLRLDSSFTTKALKSSNEDKVSVKSTGSATEGKHKIDYVKQVGEGAVIRTSSIGQVLTGKIDPDSKDNVTATTKLSDLGITEDVSLDISDGKNTKTITLQADDKISDVVRKINATNDGTSTGVKVLASYDGITGSFKIGTSSAGTSAQSISIKASGATDSKVLDKLGLATSKLTKSTKLSELGITSKHTLKVSDGEGSSDVIIDKDMTLGELAAEISQELKHGTATFDEAAGAFFISSKGTGISQKISLEVTDGPLGNFLLDKLGIGTGLSREDGLDEWYQEFSIATSATSATTKLEDAFPGLVDMDTLDVQINGVNISFDASSTIQDLADKIKEKTGAALVETEFEGGKLKFKMLDTNGNHMPANTIRIGSQEMASTPLAKSFGLLCDNKIIDDPNASLGLKSGDRLKLTTPAGDTYIDLSSDTTMNSLISSIKDTLGIAPDNISFNNGFMVIKDLASNLKIEVEKASNGVSAQGKDAIFSYNGIEMSSESNTVAVNGMEITINEVTNDPVYINVTNDTDEAFKFITNFVDEYNKLIEYGNKKVHADSYGKLEPLTSEEKEAMNESDIKLWEDKIKNGLLRNDPTLSSLLSDMRTILSSVVEDGDIKSLASIGITTSSQLSDRGKLIIDEEKLKKALAENPEEVTSLFTGSGRSAKRAYLQANKDKTAEDFEALDDKEKEKWQSKVKGIGEKMYDLLNSKFSYVANTKTSSSLFNDTVLDKDIKTTEKEYDNLVDILNDREDYYYKLFARMETTMNKLNSQQNYIAQMFASK